MAPDAPAAQACLIRRHTAFILPSAIVTTPRSTSKRGEVLDAPAPTNISKPFFFFCLSYRALKVNVSFICTACIHQLNPPDTGRGFPELQRSRSGWDQTSGGASHSNDLGMPLCRALSQGAGLDEGTIRPRGSAFLGGQQRRWETVEEKQQPGGGGRGGDERSVPGYFTALARENSFERGQSGSRPRISSAQQQPPQQQQQPERNNPNSSSSSSGGEGEFRKVLEQHMERISSPPASSFLAGIPCHWEGAGRTAPAAAAGRVARGHEHVIGDGFLTGGVTYPTEQQQHLSHHQQCHPSGSIGEDAAAAAALIGENSDGWHYRSEVRAMASPVAAHPKHGPPHNRVLYPLESSSSSSSSPPLSFHRQRTSSSSTPRLQPAFSSRSGRTLHSTFSLSSSGEGYGDVREQQQRVALGARPSVSNVTGLVVSAQDGGGADLADGLVLRDKPLLSKSFRAHHESAMSAGGRWQGADPGRTDTCSISTVSGSSSSGSFAVEGFSGRVGQQNQPLQPQQQNETANGGGGAFNVARRAPAPYHGQRHLHHHYHHHRIDRRPAVSAVSAGRDGGVGQAFGRRVSANNMASIESLPAAVGNKDRRLGNGGGVSEGGSCPTLGRADSFSLSAAEYACTKNGVDGGNPMVAAAMHSRSPAFGPSSSTVLQPPNNPQEWLQNFNLRQSRKESGSDGNDEGTNTPRTSRSSSASSSPPSLSSCGGSSLAVPQAGAAAATGSCPATDCPANGDCLPGTTPDTLVYEVRFKRATRTFLSEENLDPRSISCGTLVKVSSASSLCQ